MTFALLTVLGVLAASSPAAAVPTCADTLLADWYVDGTIGEVYAPDCYRQALDNLPEDVRVYTTAADDISRALRAELAAGETSGEGAAAPAGGASRSLSNLRAPFASEGDAEAQASGELGVDDATSSRSLPLPLLLLLGLTLLLALGASTGGIARRARRR